MPKRKAESKLSTFVNDSPDEDELAASDGNADVETPPPKRQKGRPKAAATKAVVKEPQRKTRSTAVVGPTIRAPATRRGRPPKQTALETETQHPEHGDDPEHDARKVRAGNEANSSEEDELESPQTVISPGGRPNNKPGSTTVAINDENLQYTPTGAARQRKSTSNVHKTRMPLEQSTPKGSASVGREGFRSISAAHRRSSPIKPPQLPRTPRVSSHKGGNMQPENAENEVALRRKLGEMTNKYESMEAKYKSLREIGILEANTNMEKLRKLHEESTSASKQLITSLKNELAKQANVTKQSKDLQKQLDTRGSKVTMLEQKIEEMTSGLNKAQSEIKSLQVKLTAARNAAANAESAVAARGPTARSTAASRAALNGVAESNQVAQLKEDLYSDLTSLIILDVKRRESDDMYDCIQTSLNGTLHFKLSIGRELDSRSTTSLDTTQFQYIPLLDENRDRELIEILPDFLSEPIKFPRQQAMKFYNLMVDTLMKKHV
ncbi:hypothetical protein FQN57_006528 [Myotisia sp. PD_48]|nr:hypothetical protein FQN57_006528 [Myotisia sp. PD_48]